MTHTEGPWKVYDAYDVYGNDGQPESVNCLYVGTRSGERVIQASRYGYEINMTEANARLVVAAPDLLEACESAERLCEQLQAVEELFAKSWNVNTVRRILQAAIAKAKGTADD